MLNSILTWIAGWILNYLAGMARKATTEAYDQRVKDEERNVTNEENVKKHEDAKTREDSIRTSLDLLNRVRRSP